MQKKDAFLKTDAAKNKSIHVHVVVKVAVCYITC